VYIISNLGSFGNDVFKIGMTRRIDPQERINELGSASVPFKFDVHSFIFSEDAVALENKIHEMLNKNRVNKVNLRKEFFKIPLDDLEKLVEEIDPTAEFTRTMIANEYRASLETNETYTNTYSIDIPDAEQYRISMKTRNMPAINEIANEKTKHIINNTSAVVNNKRAATEYLYTKWGIYKMPDPYKVQIQYGARTNLKEVKI